MKLGQFWDILGKYACENFQKFCKKIENIIKKFRNDTARSYELFKRNLATILRTSEWILREFVKRILKNLGNHFGEFLRLSTRKSGINLWELR